MTSESLVQENPEKKKLFPYTRKALASISKEWVAFLDTLGHVALNTRDIVGYILQGQFSLRHFIQQLAFVGIDTLGISLIMTTFSGMVIALQLAKEMAKQGAGNYVGALVSLAIVRELAPIMTAFSVIAMAGSAYAAELSTMRITNQIDALEVLHVNPVRYLLMPRVLAGMVALPMMTVITSISGILGGMLISVWMADINGGKYLESVWNQTELRDVFAMLLKAAIFGIVIFLFSTTIGLNAKGGSREVGLATTRAVVLSFVIMAVLDYVLTYLIYGSHV